MAIQFQCPSCRQPIEVDDEWAAQPVACPYCQKTVTAPETSTFLPQAPRGVASPLAADALPAEPAAGAAEQGLGAEVYTPVRSDANPLALWALISSFAAVACFVVYIVLVGPYLTSIGAETATPQEVQNRLLSDMQQGKLPDAMFAAGVAVMLGLALWVLSIILGVIALRKPTRRGMSIAALVLSGGMLLMLCFGAVSGLAGG